MNRAKMIGLLFCAVFVLTGCQEDGTVTEDPHPNMSHLENKAFATPVNPVVSASEKYTMVIETGFHDDVFDNHFVVYSSDENNHIIFTSERNYRTRDRLYFTWDEADNIWVYSGDIGTVLWQYDGVKWIECTPSSDDLEGLPDILLEAINH